MWGITYVILSFFLFFSLIWLVSILAFDLVGHSFLFPFYLFIYFGVKEAMSKI